MARKPRVSSKEQLAARQKSQQAIMLRVAGANLDQIAGQLGYANRGGAYKAIMRELGETARMMSESTEGVRQLELKRLDAMQFNIWPSVMAGDQASINTALRIQERRASLLGLDAPKQIEARIRVDVVSWNQALKDFLNIYREFHRDAPEADMVITRIDQLGQERFAGVT